MEIRLVVVHFAKSLFLTMPVCAVLLITVLTSAAFADFQKQPEEECRIQINRPDLEFEDAICMLNKKHEGHEEYRILEGKNIVVFTSLSIAPLGTFYVYNRHITYVEKSLKRFGYIKDNWKSISSAKPPVMPNKINKKVPVYEVQLKGLGPCIAFLANYGRPAGGQHWQGIVSVLGCSVGKALSIDEIRQILGDISVRDGTSALTLKSDGTAAQNYGSVVQGDNSKTLTKEEDVDREINSIRSQMKYKNLPSDTYNKIAICSRATRFLEARGGVVWRPRINSRDQNNSVKDAKLKGLDCPKIYREYGVRHQEVPKSYRSDFFYCYHRLDKHLFNYNKWNAPFIEIYEKYIKSNNIDCGKFMTAGIQ